MLVEDGAAFIEQLEVLMDPKRVDKHRRRVAQAEFEMLEALREVRVAASALEHMERTLAREVGSLPVQSVPELLRRWSARSLVRDMERVEAHLAAMRNQLTARQRRLKRAEQSARQREASRRRATMFRLHSGEHHLDCSASRFERLSAFQHERPVLLARKDGRRWWWYLNRFWWADEELTARDVEAMVFQLDLHRKQRSDAIAQAREMLLGDAGWPLPEEHISEWRITRIAG